MKWILSLLVFALPPTCLANAPPSWAESRVQHYAHYYRVPPELIAALIDVESGWNSWTILGPMDHVRSIEANRI